MGWASGSGLAEEAWDLVRSYVPEAERRGVASKFMRLFLDSDADAWSRDDSLASDAGYFDAPDLG